MSITAEQIPGYRVGTWEIDPTHSEIGFSVRHLAISKVKGKFENFNASFVTAENPLETSVQATAQVASVNTNQEQRDAHLRTGDFFLADEFPELSFVSTGARADGGDFKIDGELTMRGITRPVTFNFELGGFGSDPYGNYKVGFTAQTTVKREDFGLNWNSALETGGFVLGSDVTINLDIQAALVQ